MKVFALLGGLLTGTLLYTPAFAIAAKDKMETCKFGADDQKLTAAARKAFMAKCMANGEARGAKAKAKKT